MQFERYIGIDYSGAETATSSLKGLRVYAADLLSDPHEVAPPPSPRKYWNRQEIAEYLIDYLQHSPPTMIGVDHGFSFPIHYFQKHRLPLDYDHFLEDFREHWPTDGPHTYVCFIIDSPDRYKGRARLGSSKWFRITERWSTSAKSVFQFQVQGSVATSTHAGLPWLLRIRKACREKVHFWPFDGWEVPRGKSVIMEVYPSLWSKRFDNLEGRTADQQDAYAVAAWMQRADREGFLKTYFHPPLNPDEKRIAQIEGWIFGIV